MVVFLAIFMKLPFFGRSIQRSPLPRRSFETGRHESPLVAIMVFRSKRPVKGVKRKIATEHSQEFKDSVVARLLAKELTVAAASQQYQISEYTLYKWRKAVLNDTVVASQIVKNQQIPTVITTLHLPKDVSHMRAHEAVILMMALSGLNLSIFGCMMRLFEMHH